MVPLQFKLNGEDRAEFVGGGATLLSVLRGKINMMSPKGGCGQGGCGCCTVLIDGEPHLSCLTLAVTCEGKSVETLEGIGNEVNLHPLQKAFMEHFAAQCGYCTPGMIMAAKALLDKNANPTREDVIDALGGNVCRCTGYEPIVQAVLSAASQGGR